MTVKATTEVIFRSLGPLLNPPSVAIVGASERANWPTKIYRNLCELGYAGKIFPVNPRNSQVWGIECYPDLASLPEPPQHAVVLVPARAVQEVLEIGVASGLKSATVYAAELGEGQDETIVARGRALSTLIERSGVLLCGPNCMGINSLRERFFGYPNDAVCKLEPGSVAFVSQSGGTVYYLAKTATQRGVKFSYLVSSGNEMGVDVADYVNYFVEDPNTRVIALFVEGFRRPRAFMAAAAKALKAQKPIIAMKAGRSQNSRESARSHTGAIAGDYQAYLATCERYGIINCASLDDMVEALLVFGNGRLPRGPRVGWITTSGGTLDLLFDALDEFGGVVTPDFSPDVKAVLRPLASLQELRNPLDAGGAQSDPSSASMCAAVAADPNIDMVAWCATSHKGKGKRDPTPFQAMFKKTDKPVVGFSRLNFAVEQAEIDFQAEVGFPFLQGLPGTIKALGALAFYGQRAGREVKLAPPVTGRHTLQAADLGAALAEAGIRLPKQAFAASPKEAAEAARGIGFPVALKIVSPDIVHKTEVGGVHLDLRSADQVESEAAALLAAIRLREPGAHIDGVAIQEMVSGIEVILGARTDPLYGPIMLVGSGGVFVELLGDVSLRLLPIGPEDARRMIEEVKIGKLLAGFRGRQPGDIDALVRAMCGLSELYLDRGLRLGDLEINPLSVLPPGAGVCALDVRCLAANDPA